MGTCKASVSVCAQDAVSTEPLTRAFLTAFNLNVHMSFTVSVAQSERRVARCVKRVILIEGCIIEVVL